MKKFKIELFLQNGDVTSYVIESNMPLSEVDEGVSNSLNNGLFITAEESDTSVLSVRCSLVEKYRITIID